MHQVVQQGVFFSFVFSCLGTGAPRIQSLSLHHMYVFLIILIYQIATLFEIETFPVCRSNKVLERGGFILLGKMACFT